MSNRITLLAVVLVTAAITASPALATTAPVGVWTLDEGSGTHLADGSGNGNNGLLSGGVSWVPGISGSALSFDGGGQVKVADNTVLEPRSTVTVSAWIKQAGSPGDYRYIVAKGANGCIAASYGLYSGPDGGLDFYVSQHHGSVYARSPDAGQRVWNGNWHLAVGTYDGSTIQLYVDGVQVGVGTSWPGSLEYLLPDSNDFYIGNYPGCADHEFLGAVDDVIVWDRTLGAGEIGGLLQPGGSSSQPTSPSGGGNQAGGTQGSGTQGGGATPTTGGGSRGTGAPATTNGSAPSIHGLKLSGSMVTYTESQASGLTVTLLRAEKGVRRGQRCVAPSGHHRARSCTHFVVISSVTHTDRAGRLTVGLSQLLHRRLSPGTYRLDLTPRAHGKVGKTVSVRLVVRHPRARG